MPFFRSKSSTDTSTITPEMVADNRKKLTAMVANKYIATSMHLLTKETIFRVSIETFSECIKTTKKVLKLGSREYKIGGKTDTLLKKFHNACRNFETATFQMKIKLIPTKAEEYLFEWIEKDDMEREQLELTDGNEETASDIVKK